MAGLTLDAGALIAYERGQERIRKILAVAYERGFVPTVPAVALAEVWRGDAKNARVARLLKACAIEVVDEALARAAGSLRRATRGAGAVDACIAVSAAVATRSPHLTPTTCARSSETTSRSSLSDTAGTRQLGA